MEILLPEQTTVDDIVFSPVELIGPKNEKTARQQAGTILS
jgi:hypothetical protein